MAGHSKWTNTKHRKETQDAKRSKIFTKIIRELVTATRLGGDNPSSNPRLRAAIDKALSNNMTRETLNRAILRGMRNDENIKMETFIYEGYGPGGTAIIVECLSENRNRTVAEVRHAFNRCGGSLGTNGSVAFLFNKKGVLFFKKGNKNTITKTILETVPDSTLTSSGDNIIVYTAWKKINFVHNILEKDGLKADSIEVSMIPSTKVNLSIETTLKLQHLVHALENCDDVQEVYHNGKMFDEVTISS